MFLAVSIACRSGVLFVLSCACYVHSLQCLALQFHRCECAAVASVQRDAARQHAEHSAGESLLPLLLLLLRRAVVDLAVASAFRLFRADCVFVW